MHLKELVGTPTFTGRVQHPQIPDLVWDVYKEEGAEFSLSLERNE